ncbi:MAG: transposase [Gammaproteobacteria bacterium]
MRFYLGIDVSKAKLDCCLLDVASGKRKSKSVENSAAGAASLLAWCAKHQALPGDVHVVMEPTGVYHERAALALTDAGLTVSLVNPLHLRRFADSLGALRKTDAADAAVLARFGRERQPEPWQPPRPAVHQLQALLARRDALARDLRRERNRLEQAALGKAPQLVLDSIGNSIKHLDKQLRTLEQAISDHIDQDPDLRQRRELLLSIPGVGDRLAHRFTALLGDGRFDSAEQLAAYLGLIPVEWQSGTSVRAPARLSKKGPAHIRALLYLPAVVAKQHNAHVRALYERLLARGKSKMAAIGAAMRKLVHLCFGVVKSGQPYSPVWDPKNP